LAPSSFNAWAAWANSVPAVSIMFIDEDARLALDFADDVHHPSTRWGRGRRLSMMANSESSRPFGESKRRPRNHTADIQADTTTPFSCTTAFPRVTPTKQATPYTIVTGYRKKAAVSGSAMQIDRQ